MNNTMEYKGYIIEADDVNFDNDKENLYKAILYRQNSWFLSK